MKQRDIYIVSQEGLDPEANIAAGEGIQEIMDCFPSNKSGYPITNLGAWKDDGYQYVRNGRLYLTRYKSTQWYIAKAQEAAKVDLRWHPGCHQLNADVFFELMEKDPTNRDIPQFTIFLTRDDLYARYHGVLLNYCLGLSQRGKGSVVSAHRYLNRNGYLVGQRREVFKTVVMHEFGHVIGLTYDGRKNTDENLGSHCTCNTCIMQQRERGDYEQLARIRQNLQRQGVPPICDDCIDA